MVVMRENICRWKHIYYLASLLLILPVAIYYKARVNESGEVTIKNESTKEYIELQPWSIILELFSDTKESLGVWGEHPVYLPSSLESLQKQESSIFPLISPREKPNIHRFSDLFKLEDSLTILGNTDLVHGKDYFVLKYIIKDGEEWNGQLPYSSIPVQEIPRLLEQKGFSLVINKLQNHWESVRDFARSLELETSAPHVSCNLYVTPPGSARAFESHMDWMDVIVLQLYGEKNWSVWLDPMIKLVPPDLKRKPTLNEMKSSPFHNVLLQPGDALYIPRGHLHNATTPEHGNISLHLTFGIEFGFESTLEALIHLSLVSFAEENNLARKPIVYSTSSQCSGKHKLTLEKVLHYSISALVRQTNCGGFGEYSAKKETLEDEAICSLRKSIPLHPQFQKLNGNTDTEIESQYVAALETIMHQASFKDAIDFMNQLSADDKSEEVSLGSNPYTYIGMDASEHFHCVLAEKDMFQYQNDLNLLVKEFYDDRKSTFMVTRKRLLDDIDKKRLLHWQEED